MVQHESQTEAAKDMIAEFVQQAMQGQVVMAATSRPRSRPYRRDRPAPVGAAERDHARRALPAPRGSWRGLHHLVFESETSATAQVRVLNVSKKELQGPRNGPRVRPARVFKKVYEEEYGTFGGAPTAACR